MVNDTGSGADASSGGLDGRLIADRYRVEEVVSAGANTIITNAVDQDTGGPVTLKVVQPDLAGSEEFRQAFRRHAEVATALTHPNIASVLDWGDVDLGDESSVFWVVEYLGGGSLRDLFDRGRLLEPSQALVVGLEACRALDVAHQRGIVHTELTPAKMVFGDDRRLRIVDFGFARLLGAAAWEDPAHVPTHVARYASPEQAIGLEIDSKTDVYALTLSLIESLTGSVPFSGDSTVATLAGRVGKLMPVSADMGSLAAVLERAGRPEADDRSSAAEFGRGLVQAAEKLPRPEPIPIVTAGLFAPANMRRPSDPTGGIERTPEEPPETGEDAVDEVGDDGAAGVAAAAAVAGAAVAGAAVAGAAATDAPTGDATPDGVSDNDVSDTEATDTVPADTATADEELPETQPIETVGDDAPDTVPADEELPETQPIETVGDDAPDTATADEELPETQPIETVGDDAPGSAPEAEPLLLVTEIADPPSGAVQVGAGEAAGAAAATAVATEVATEAAPAVEATTQMPVAPPPPGDQPAQVYDEERPKRRIGTIVLLVVFVIAGIAALSYAGWLLLRTKSFDVPDLAGVNQDVALNEISGNGWLVTIEEERNDAEPTIGNVIRTLPGPGVSLEEGEAFLMVVSLGPELRTLPVLNGLALTDAEAALRELRLQPVVDNREFSETVPLDRVIGWQVQGDPAAVAGTQVLPDTVVLLNVSDGPEPRPAPTLANLTIEEAQAAVDALQLTLVIGEDAFSDTVEPGRIVAQVPDPGVAVERGGSVEVRVSKGPDVIALPDLTGLSYTDAEQLLLDTGFTIGNLLGTTEGTFVSITVNGETVEVGQIFDRGTAVDVIFL